MGFKEKLLGIVNGRKENKKSDTERTEIVTMPDLISALDETAGKMKLMEVTEEKCAQYIDILNNVKNEISGLTNLQTIPQLPQILQKIFTLTLPKVFLFGSREDVETAKRTVFAGIRAMVSDEKTQQLATIDLQIQAVNVEILENKFWILKYQGERKEKKQVCAEEPDNDLLEISILNLSVQIKSLQKRNETANILLEELIEKKHSVESDALGEAFSALNDMISNFVKDLPTAVERARAAERIEEIGDTALARMRSGANLMARTLGGVEDEAEEAASQNTAHGKEKVEETQSQEQEIAPVAESAKV